MALHDWRAAAKSVARRRGLAITVAATLGLGLGANSIIFSAVDAVLLKPLPYPDADRLAAVYERNASLRQATQLVAPGRLEEWNERNSTFDGLAAWYFENMADTSGALPERVEAMRTSPRFFRVLGVTPLLGRWPTDDEERFGGPPAAVVSHGFWVRRLDADPAVVGRSLKLGATTWSIVGVMPATFAYPTATVDVWLPTRAPATFLAARAARLYTTIGRLKPGVSLDQAEGDLDAVQARLGAQYPATDRGWGAALAPLKEQEVGATRRSLWLLLGAVALVLLATCANVACLMLADASRREHELSVRFALGAGRALLAAQLLREGVVLAFAGALGGLAAARWGLPILRAAAADLPRMAGASIDTRVVAFTFSVGAATTVLFAVVPAVHATRRDIADHLSRGGRARIGGRHLMQRALVISQVALAIVLLAGAGLLIRSFSNLAGLNPGFDPTGVLVFRISAQWSERTTAVVQRQSRTIARLREIPGVEAAAFSQVTPGTVDIPANEFHFVGRDPAERTFAAGRAVSAGYFSTLHVPILEGETCSSDPASPPFSTALVTRAFAERFFPGGDPIGHDLLGPGQIDRTARIIGLVGDVRENGPSRAPEPLIYWCGFNGYWPDPFFLVRTTAAQPASMAAIRAAIREIEPERAVYAAQPLADTLSRSLAQQRLATLMLTLFAASAVLLATIGLYGVLSQIVASRRREIGVRLALGAQPIGIAIRVVAQAAAMTAAGIVLGLVAALAVSSFLASMVFGISPHDPATLAVAPAILLLVAAAAAFVPVRRAGRVDPVEALRED